MKKKNIENFQVQVGAFLAIGILLAVMSIFMLGSRSNLFQDQYTLICYFEDISGLRTGAPVQLAGLNVGVVEDISFVESLAKTEVKLILKINSAYQRRIRADSVATVATQGLLGDRMVFITVGTEKTEQLQDESILQVKNPTGFTQLVEKGDELIIDARRFMQNTDKLVGKFNLAMDEVNKGKGLVHAVIYDKEGGRAISEISAMAENLNVVSRDFARIVSKINTGKGTIGALVNDPSLFNDVKTLLGKANRNKLIRSVIRYTLKTNDKEQLP